MVHRACPPWWIFHGFGQCDAAKGCRIARGRCGRRRPGLAIDRRVVGAAGRTLEHRLVPGAGHSRPAAPQVNLDDRALQLVQPLVRQSGGDYAAAAPAEEVYRPGAGEAALEVEDDPRARLRPRYDAQA